MSDDLISKKAVIALIDKLGYINVSSRDNFNANCRMDKVRQEVVKLPTAFDTEKVIAELVNLRQKKIDVTISLFYEVRDAEIFGGKGEVGYSQSSIDLHTENLTSFKLQEYAQDQIAGIAKFCKVPQENIRIIKRQEYEENTEED